MYNTFLRKPNKRISRFFLLALAGMIFSLAGEALGQKPPQTIFLSGEKLSRNRQTLSSNADPVHKAALRKLTRQADKLLKSGKLYSVMNKEQVPPSGDKHDYMSQAPYWWPDPVKPNGLPYLRRDGERNPELDKISDAGEMDDVVRDSETLALVYYFTGDERYAKHASSVIRTWFLDLKTRQNPNLNFAQGVPGINKGRGIGLIETRDLYRVIDAAILLQGSRSWSLEDHGALKKWFSDFVKWMLESPVGRDEADEKNNHGTYYDVQVIVYSLFAGRPAVARRQIVVTKERISSQIEKDGRQPLELSRTLSWGYVNMNLLGFFTIARLAENVNVDLWNYQAADGRSIRKALDWLMPFIGTEKKWDYPQIKPRKFDRTAEILRIASQKYAKPEYYSLATSLETDAGIEAITH